MKWQTGLLAVGGLALAVAWAAQQGGAAQRGGTPTPVTPVAPTAAQPAAPAKSTTPAAGDPRVELARKLGNVHVDDLRLSPIPGIYELTRGADVAYVTADGKYAITGDLYDLANSSNLTEQHRNETRARLVAAFPESQMLIFGPSDSKYTITVFTDIDCPYCRKLHSQIDQYNRLGIRVRYLLFPRTGPNTSSWTKAEQVWCSPDRNAALTRAKQGQDLKVKPCADNPVARSYALGEEFALQGTPGIVLADGELLPGYVPPEELLQELKTGPKR
ncbi:MAG: DsbC family protein [Proteobacteria bacterium]|nr:DsbC family protein [Pseudomonadota bacterium]